MSISNLCSLGICPAGQGRLNIGEYHCSDCPVDSYSNVAGNECLSCKDGYDTYNKTGSIKCHSK